MSTETETQVAAALAAAAAGITHTITLVGPTTRDKWECDQWRVTIGTETFDYYTGTGHRRYMVGKTAMKRPSAAIAGRPGTVFAERWDAANLRPVAPHIASVLHSLLLDSSAASQTFREWCYELGMDDDSIKARNTYDACQRTADQLARVIPHDVRETLSTLLQDY